ncbi:hypothetical protein CI088_13205 [Enterococcus plantarum]|uniref:Bacterial Ig domain-containing protein n=1 Tax=Enterococcus plantarum TaxID=1077675 RepID=A0A2W4BEI6_9ENTE|nr:hypothetical protein CI088_13205 [Enterococcus plantarum]
MFAKISKNKLLIFKTFFIFIGFISFFFGNAKEVLAESVTPNISYPAPSMGNKIHDYHYDIQISGFLYNVYNSKTEVAVFPDNTDASEFYSKKTLEIYYANTGKIETYSVPVRTDIVNENSNFGLPKESVPELVTFLSNKENAGIPVYFRLSKDNSNQAGYWNGPNTFEVPFDADEHKPVINQPTEGDQVVSGTGVPGDTIVITDGNGNELGTGTVDGDGKFEIPVNRPLEKGETITGTPETDGQKGTPGTTVVAEKPFDPEAHKPVINQPTEGNQVVSDAKNSNSNQGKERYALPKMGEKDNLFLYCVGLLLIIFILSIILYRKSDFEAK